MLPPRFIFLSLGVVALMLVAVVARENRGEEDVPNAALNGSMPILIKASKKSFFLPISYGQSGNDLQLPTVPKTAPGTILTRFAEGLDHPRWLYVLPNGDVLVAETSTPLSPERQPGLKDWALKKLHKRAPVQPSANRISLLRDTDGDGVADMHTVFLEGLNAPFGMALAGRYLYIADTDAVLRYRYVPGQTEMTATPIRVVTLPTGPVNRHWTRNLIASPGGYKLYVTVGSDSDVAERGMWAEKGRAAIWEVYVRTGAHRVFASGLRNPTGLAWEPESRRLWTAVDERDALDSQPVPDYITSVREGGFYGWPYNYGGNGLDQSLAPPKPKRLAKALAPDYPVGPHATLLGLASARGSAVSDEFKNGMFVSQYGSASRKVQDGYKVVFVPFSRGKPTGDKPKDVLTGFVDAKGQAFGRPAGVAIDTRGGLLVADDIGDVIWRVSAASRISNAIMAEAR